MFVNFNILNQLGSPAINSNTFANRPAAGQTGRLFVSTDTFEIYRDNGTTWDLIGGPGSSTITGTGTATQVAYFTSSQAIGSSANLYWDNTAGALGINTATPGAELDVHGTGTIAQFNTTAATGNVFLAIQRSGTGLWRIGDTYNGGSNYFELHNTTLASNAIQIAAATNKSILTSIETYSTGVARGNYLDYTLSLPNGTTFTSPNTVTALGATLNLNIAGSATIPAGARSGADFFNGINFTSAGTFTVNQASTIRAFSNVTAGWAFNGSAVGTVTHLAGLRVLFPTNSGSAINVTDNYALLINNQNANTGTITYTNRWGIYQEGASDLNYMAANLLLGSTTNTGDKLQVTGTTYLSSQLTVGNTLYVDTVFNRVGIGTLSPAYTLDVNGAIQSSVASGNGSVYFNNSSLTGKFWTVIPITSGSESNLEWYYGGTGAGTKITFTNGGNVGIGTTSPLIRLEVASDGLNWISGTFTGAGGSDKVVVGNLYGATIGGHNSSLSSWAALSINPDGGTVRIGQNSSNNVLIGTATDAGQKLQVNGDISSTGYITGAGTNPGGLGGSKYVIDWNGGNMRLFSYGANTSTNGGIVFNSQRSNGTNSIDFLTLSSSGAATFTSSLTTGAPSGGTAAAWKLGSRVAAAVALDATQYIELDVGGTLYKLAIVT